MKVFYRFLIVLIIGIPLILLNICGKILRKVGEVIEDSTIDFNNSNFLKFIMDKGREK
jgi:hypothetical protein